MEKTRNYPLLKNDFIYNKMVRFFINYNYLDILIKQESQLKPLLPNYLMQELLYALYASNQDRLRNRGRIIDFIGVYIKKIIDDCRKVQVDMKQIVYAPESTLKITSKIFEEFEARRKYILVNNSIGKPIKHVPRWIINVVIQKIYGKSESESCDNPSIILKVKNLGQRWIREQRAKKTTNHNGTNSEEQKCDESTILNNSTATDQGTATQSHDDLDANQSSCKKRPMSCDVSSTSPEPEASTKINFNPNVPSTSRDSSCEISEITEKSKESIKNDLSEVIILSSTESDNEETCEKKKTPIKRRRDNSVSPGLTIEKLSAQNEKLKIAQKKLEAELIKRQKMLDEKDKKMKSEIAAVTEDNQYLMKRCKKYLRKITKKDEVIEQLSSQLNEFYEMRDRMNKITTKPTKIDES